MTHSPLALCRFAVRKFLQDCPMLAHLEDDLVGAAMLEHRRLSAKYDPARGAWSTYFLRCLRSRLWAVARGDQAAHVPGERTGYTRVRSMPIETPLDDQGHTLLDLLADDGPSPEAEALEVDTRASVRDLLASLPARDYCVVALRLGFVDDEPRTFEEAGEALGLSRQRAQQIEGRALAFLRREALRRGLAA